MTQEKKKKRKTVKILHRLRITEKKYTLKVCARDKSENIITNSYTVRNRMRIGQVKC